MLATGAGHEAPQREILAQILARGRIGIALQAVLDLLECLEADQRFMLARMEMEVPFLDRDVSCIERTSQKIEDGLEIHLTAPGPGYGRERFQKAFYFDNRLKASSCKTLKCFCQYPGNRLVGHQHLAVTGHVVIAVADNRREYPIAVHHAGAHAVDHLFRVLLALMLTDGGKQVLDKDTVRVRPEFDGRAFQFAACPIYGAAQIDMGLDIAGKAGDVIDDYGMRLRASMLPQKFQHGLHAGTVNETAGDSFIPEDLHNFIVLVLCVIPATGFLGAQPMPALDLRGAGNAAIDDRPFIRRGDIHG